MTPWQLAHKQARAMRSSKNRRRDARRLLKTLKAAVRG